VPGAGAKYKTGPKKIIRGSIEPAGLNGEFKLSTTTASAAPIGGTAYGTPAYRTYVLIVLTLVYTLNFIDRNLMSVIAQPIIT
jgi:hypothetical protein